MRAPAPGLPLLLVAALARLRERGAQRGLRQVLSARVGRCDLRMYRIQMTMAAGHCADFEETARRMVGGELETALADADEPAHADLARARAAIHSETGRPRYGARVGTDFLGRHGAWATPVLVEDFAIARDAAWRADWGGRLEGEYRGMVWGHGYAGIAETARKQRRRPWRWLASRRSNSIGQRR